MWLEQFRYSEINDFYVFAFHDYVLQFQITVSYMFYVQTFESFEALLDYSLHFLFFELTFLVEQNAEIASFAILYD